MYEFTLLRKYVCIYVLYYVKTFFSAKKHMLNYQYSKEFTIFKICQYKC